MKYYSIYKGDKFLFEGTIIQCANYLNIKISSAKFYTSPTYHKRNKKGIKIYRIEE